MHVVVADAASGRVIETIIETAGHDVTSAASAADAFRSVIVDKADAIILESTLPDVSGLELCRELRTHGYAGIVMFVAHDNEPHTKVAAFQSGADDYLAKPFDPSELLARIAAIANRLQRTPFESDFRPGMESDYAALTVSNAELNMRDLTFRRDDQEPITLTPVEMRLLEILMRYADTTVSRDTLIDHVWGVELEGDTNRLDVYVRRLRQKIESHPGKPRYLHTIRRLGYMFKSPDTAES